MGSKQKHLSARLPFITSCARSLLSRECGQRTEVSLPLSPFAQTKARKVYRIALRGSAPQPQVPPSQPPVTTLQDTETPMFFFLAWIFALRYWGMPEVSGYPA